MSSNSVRQSSVFKTEGRSSTSSKFFGFWKCYIDIVKEGKKAFVALYAYNAASSTKDKPEFTLILVCNAGGGANKEAINDF